MSASAQPATVAPPAKTEEVLAFTSPFGGANTSATVPMNPQKPQRRLSEVYIDRSDAAKNIAMQNRPTEDDDDDY